MTETDERGSRRRRAWDVALLASFAAASLAPTVDQITRPDEARDPAPENRAAAPFPGFPRSWSKLTAFPAAYESSYLDTFGLRDVLLGWNSLVRHYVFQVGTSNSLVPDGTDWINYSGEWTLDIHRGLRPFSRAELEAWRQALEARSSALAQLGIRYTFIIAPNKETIYPERVPDRYNRLGPTRLDQLVEWLRLHSTMQLLDLREHLFAEKPHDQPGDYVYNQLGTHWNARGFLVVYRVLLSKVREWFPETHMLTSEELTVLDVPVNHDSWAEHMYIPDVLVEQERNVYLRNTIPKPPILTEVGPPSRVVWEDGPLLGPRVYLYHDSFGGSLFTTGPATFPRFEALLSADFDLDKIQESGAELVVELFVERMLALRGLASLVPPAPLTPVEPPVTHVIASWEGSSLQEGFDGAAPEIRSFYDAERLRTMWVPTPSSTRLELELEVESTIRGQIEVYWRSDPSESFSRFRRATARVGAGSDRARFHVGPLSGTSSQFLFRALDGDQVSTIRSVELRAPGP
jgi:hypothetical protein